MLCPTVRPSCPWWYGFPGRTSRGSARRRGRLASQMQRPVTLDEAVSYRLRSARPSATHAKPSGEQPAAVSSAVTSLPRISGTA